MSLSSCIIQLCLYNGMSTDYNRNNFMSTRMYVLSLFVLVELKMFSYCFVLYIYAMCHNASITLNIRGKKLYLTHTKGQSRTNNNFHRRPENETKHSTGKHEPPSHAVHPTQNVQASCKRSTDILHQFKRSGGGGEFQYKRACCWCVGIAL